LLAAAISAFIVYRLTASVLLSVFIYVVSVNYLQAFSFEPGHPQALAYLLVAGIVALFASMSSIPRAAFAIVLGALVGLLLLTKVNIGVYTMLAVGLALSAGTSGTIAFRLQQAIGAIMAALPVGLIYQRIQTSFWFITHLSLLVILALVIFAPLLLRGGGRVWGLIAAACAAILLTVCPSANSYEFHFGVLVAFSACGVALVAQASRPDTGLRYQEWLLVLLGGGTAIVVILAAILIFGTSLHGVMEGLFWGPARFYKIASVGHLDSLPGAIIPLTALAGLLACYGYVYARVPQSDRSWYHYMLASAKGIFALLVFVNPNPSMPPIFVSWARWLPASIPPWPPLFLSFAWLAAVPEANRPAEQIARIGLVAVAVMQPLIAFPAGGSQCASGGVLIFVVAALCLSDAIQTFKSLLPDSIRVSWLRSAIGVAVAFAILFPFYKQASGMYKHYSSLTPLELPGASRIRLNAEDVHLYRNLVRWVARPEVETFLTLPGVNSLYLWAQKDPPTGFNITFVMGLLDDRRQEQIWESFNKRSGVVVIKDEKWPPARWGNVPLAKHVKENFKTITTIGHYEVMVRQ
jgi:hypothetical protein